ncbi:MAG: hypothetical protein K2X66_07660 [Cyanobacteria bacterium]|nr:hypothetical protein [Cyanobacteriota bacterium]
MSFANSSGEGDGFENAMGRRPQYRLMQRLTNSGLKPDAGTIMEVLVQCQE